MNFEKKQKQCLDFGCESLLSKPHHCWDTGFICDATDISLPGALTRLNHRIAREINRREEFSTQSAIPASPWNSK